MYLTNGDFEQELTIGWARHFQDMNGIDTIDHATFYQACANCDVGQMASDAAYGKLLQTVDVVISCFESSVNTELNAYEYSPATLYWARASVNLTYLTKEK